MSQDDRCDHGATGFCMQCCREGEGKGGEPRESPFCAWGRAFRRPDGAICYGNKWGGRGGYCSTHQHLAGTPEEIYARAKKDAEDKLRIWAQRIEVAARQAPTSADPLVVRTLRNAAESLQRGETDPDWAR